MISCTKQQIEKNDTAVKVNTEAKFSAEEQKTQIRTFGVQGRNVVLTHGAGIQGESEILYYPTSTDEIAFNIVLENRLAQIKAYDAADQVIDPPYNSTKNIDNYKVTFGNDVRKYIFKTISIKLTDLSIKKLSFDGIDATFVHQTLIQEGTITLDINKFITSFNPQITLVNSAAIIKKYSINDVEITSNQIPAYYTVEYLGLVKKYILKLTMPNSTYCDLSSSEEFRITDFIYPNANAEVSLDAIELSLNNPLDLNSVFNPSLVKFTPKGANLEWLDENLEPITNKQWPSFYHITCVYANGMVEKAIKQFNVIK